MISSPAQPRLASLTRTPLHVLVFALLPGAAACSNPPQPLHQPDAGLEQATSPARDLDPALRADGATPATPHGDDERSRANLDAGPALESDAASAAPNSDASLATDDATTPAADSGATDLDDDPDPDEDAGTNPPACTSRSCLCTMICERGTSLGCLDEEPFEDCLALCDRAPPAACADEAARVLTCNAAQPASSYSCDPDLWVFVIDGCVSDEATLRACRTR